MIGKPATPEAYQLLHEGALAFAQVEQDGMRIDTAYLKKAMSGTEKRIAKNQRQLEGHSLFKKWKRMFREKTKLGSRQQMVRVLYEEGVLKEAAINKKTGYIKADETVLEKANHPFVRKYLTTEKLKKALGTYLKGLEREVCDGFIHTSFNLNIPITYRGSSSNPNAQNIPSREQGPAKLVRTAFIPRKGHQLVELDFKGVEVSVAACYNKDPVLVDYVKDKSKDMHRDMAAEIFHCKIDQVTKNMRFHSKNQFVFAEFYGSVHQQIAPKLWESLLRYNLEMEDGTNVRDHLKKHGIKTLGECSFDSSAKRGTFEYHLAKVENSFWDKRFKVYAEWKKQWWNQYLRRGWAKYHTGFVVRGLYKRNEVINYPIQGAAFHCLLWCLIEMVKWLKKNNMKTKVICQIHDSMLSDVHNDEMEDYMAHAKYLMREAIREHWKWIIVPLDVDCEVAATNWYEKTESPLWLS